MEISCQLYHVLPCQESKNSLQISVRGTQSSFLALTGTVNEFPEFSKLYLFKYGFYNIWFRSIPSLK